MRVGKRRHRATPSSTIRRIEATISEAAKIGHKQGPGIAFTRSACRGEFSGHRMCTNTTLFQRRTQEGLRANAREKAAAS